VLFSHGLDAPPGVTELANRVGVVIYVIDPSGYKYPTSIGANSHSPPSLSHRLRQTATKRGVNSRPDPLSPSNVRCLAFDPRPRDAIVRWK
jgi:hypothetical protein